MDRAAPRLPLLWTELNLVFLCCGQSCTSSSSSVQMGGTEGIGVCDHRVHRSCPCVAPPTCDGTTGSASAGPLVVLILIPRFSLCRCWSSCQSQTRRGLTLPRLENTWSESLMQRSVCLSEEVFVKHGNRSSVPTFWYRVCVALWPNVHLGPPAHPVRSVQCLAQESLACSRETVAMQAF